MDNFCIYYDVRSCSERWPNSCGNLLWTINWPAYAHTEKVRQNTVGSAIAGAGNSGVTKSREQLEQWMSETNSLLHKRLRDRAIKRRTLRALTLTSFILIVATEIAPNADGQVVLGAFLGIALYHFSIELENLKDSE